MILFNPENHVNLRHFFKMWKRVLKVEMKLIDIFNNEIPPMLKQEFLKWATQSYINPYIYSNNNSYYRDNILYTDYMSLKKGLDRHYVSQTIPELKLLHSLPPFNTTNIKARIKKLLEDNSINYRWWANITFYIPEYIKVSINFLNGSNFYHFNIPIKELKRSFNSDLKVLSILPTGSTNINPFIITNSNSSNNTVNNPELTWEDWLLEHFIPFCLNKETRFNLLSNRDKNKSIFLKAFNHKPNAAKNNNLLWDFYLKVKQAGMHLEANRYGISTDSFYHILSESPYKRWNKEQKEINDKLTI